MLMRVPASIEMPQEKTVMVKKLTWALAATVIFLGTGPVQAGELEELKAMLLTLQERIARLEAKQNAAPTTAPAPTPAKPAVPVIAGDLPGSIKIPGSDTSLKIYGYAQLDATHDFKGRTGDINNNDYASVIFVQPFDSGPNGNARKGQTYFTARTSRLGLMTSTPTPSGALTIKVEGDFNAPNQFQGELGPNGMIFRLRHAYGELGNWLVGQTWSNFLDLRSYPETVDFNPPGSVGLLRHPQVRYTHGVGGATMSMAIENPQSLTFANDFDRTPDFTLRMAKGGDWGHVSAQAATLEYRNDNHSKRGYGLGVSGSFALGRDTLAWGLQGGDGIGRYMFNSILQGATDTGTDIRTWRANGRNVGYTHVWNPTVRSNLVLSQTRFGSDALANAAQRALGNADLFPNRELDQVFVNTFWGVAKNTEIGLEYAYGRRVTQNDEVGTQKRVNATVHYNLY